VEKERQSSKYLSLSAGIKSFLWFGYMPVPRKDDTGYSIGVEYHQLQRDCHLRNCQHAGFVPNKADSTMFLVSSARSVPVREADVSAAVKFSS
jgi:hypothetical protein